MTIELLSTISLVCFIASAVLLLLSVALFFILDIPKVYGEVSGKTARKAIEAINNRNRSDGTTSRKNKAASRKLTDKITESGRLVPKTGALEPKVKTEKFATDALISQANKQPEISPDFNVQKTDYKVGQTTVIGDITQEIPVQPVTVGGTTVLPHTVEVVGGTTVLPHTAEVVGGTTVLPSVNEVAYENSFGKTTILQAQEPYTPPQGFAETTVLRQVPEEKVVKAKPVVAVDVEIGFTGSEEIII